jgi:hypothetical protein
LDRRSRTKAAIPDDGSMPSAACEDGRRKSNVHLRSRQLRTTSHSGAADLPFKSTTTSSRRSGSATKIRVASPFRGRVRRKVGACAPIGRQQSNRLLRRNNRAACRSALVALFFRGKNVARGDRPTCGWVAASIPRNCWPPAIGHRRGQSDSPETKGSRRSGSHTNVSRGRAGPGCSGAISGARSCE